MYRTTDPRFRRRLTELGATLESANESAQSGLYIFGTTYVQPCLGGVAACFTSCIDASCPSLNLASSRRERLRRRQRGRAEVNFDFYDDWDEEGDEEGLLGWGSDVTGGGYGTLGIASANAQPAARQQRGMSYPKARRKSLVGAEDVNVIPKSSFFGKLFGGRALRYKPSAADLQEHPGKMRLGRDFGEGEALLEESSGGEEGAARRTHRRARSGTATSGDTADSYSSRGDIFPSDEEDDAVPLDDEFAMVLERRTTGGGLDTESSSNKTTDRKRGKRPSGGSRRSTFTNRTASSRSDRSTGKRKSSRTSSLAESTPIEEAMEVLAAQQQDLPAMTELKHEELQVERDEEADVERKRQESQRLAAERGLAAEDLSASKEAMPPHATSPAVEEPSQLLTPVPTDDEEADPPDPPVEVSGETPKS